LPCCAAASTREKGNLLPSAPTVGLVEVGDGVAPGCILFIALYGQRRGGRWWKSSSRRIFGGQNFQNMLLYLQYLGSSGWRALMNRCWAVASGRVVLRYGALDKRAELHLYDYWPLRRCGGWEGLFSLWTWNQRSIRAFAVWCCRLRRFSGLVAYHGMAR